MAHLGGVELQRVLQQGVGVRGQAVVQQQVGGVAQGQVAVGRRGRGQALPQAAQGAAPVAAGAPEDGRLVVQQPARRLGLRTAGGEGGASKGSHQSGPDYLRPIREEH